MGYLCHMQSTDPILIIVGKFCDLLQQHPAADIWLAFGTGTKFRHIHVNVMCNVLGTEKFIVLPVLLAVIQLPHFLGKEKSAWDAWKSFPGVTIAFLYMNNYPHTPFTIE